MAQPSMGNDIHGMAGYMKSIWDIFQRPDNSNKAILDKMAEMTAILTDMAADIKAIKEQGAITDPPITGIDIEHGPVTTE